MSTTIKAGMTVSVVGSHYGEGHLFFARVRWVAGAEAGVTELGTKHVVTYPLEQLAPRS